MKIYYDLPDCDNDLEIEAMRLLYENFKLKLMWKLRELESRIKEENGCIFIDRVIEEIPPSMRFEGFSIELESMIKAILRS